MKDAKSIEQVPVGGLSIRCVKHALTGYTSQLSVLSTPCGPGKNRSENALKHKELSFGTAAISAPHRHSFSTILINRFQLLSLKQPNKVEIFPFNEPKARFKFNNKSGNHIWSKSFCRFVS